MNKKYVKHIVKEGARFHVISYLGINHLGNQTEVQHCSELNCEINKNYDELVSEGVIDR